jgi:hypothetical protein
LVRVRFHRGYIVTGRQVGAVPEVDVAWPAESGEAEADAAHAGLGCPRPISVGIDGTRLLF